MSVKLVTSQLPVWTAAQGQALNVLTFAPVISPLPQVSSNQSIKLPLLILNLFLLLSWYRLCGRVE